MVPKNIKGSGYILIYFGHPPGAVTLAPLYISQMRRRTTAPHG